MGDGGFRRRRLRRPGGPSPPCTRRGSRDNHSASLSSRRASQGDAPTQWNASPLEIDRLGPKYVSLHHPMFAAPVEADWPGPTAAGTAIANARHDAMPVSVVKVVRPSGFDWGDAGIGAGVASLTLALVAMLVMLVTRRSRRTIAPERSELAGT